MKNNTYSHFILYSKGWYQKNHPYIDMQILIGHWSGLDPIHVDDRNIYSVLSTMVYPYIDERKFGRFVEICLESKYGKNINKMERFIEACMEVLNFLGISDATDGVCEPDYVNVLPKRSE